MTTAVGTGMVGAPACGDVMKLQIKVGADGVIEDAKFKTYGCGSAIASSSLVTEWVKGKTLDQALTIKNTQIAEELALPPVKIHCSILAEDAIKAAVADYKSKHGDGSEAAVAHAQAVPLIGGLGPDTTMAITLTESAAKHVAGYLTKRGKGIGLRLGVRTTGCSGLGVQARIRRRHCAGRSQLSKAMASRSSLTRRACRISTAPNSTSRAKA